MQMDSYLADLVDVGLLGQVLVYAYATYLVRICKQECKGFITWPICVCDGRSSSRPIAKQVLIKAVPRARGGRGKTKQQMRVSN
jgi:hypothetical protein